VQGVFSVSSGTSTFYLLGREDAGSWRATDLQLTLLYVRTAYGTVASPVANATGLGSEKVATAGPSAAAFEAERAEARAFGAARIGRELEEMRGRLEELTRRLDATQLAERVRTHVGGAGGVVP